MTTKDKISGVVSNRAIGYDQYYDNPGEILQYRGAYWKDLTSSQIHVVFGTLVNRQIRVHIWVNNLSHRFGAGKITMKFRKGRR